VITNIAGFLANPDFQSGLGTPAYLYMKDAKEYYAKVKELSKTHT